MASRHKNGDDCMRGCSRAKYSTQRPYEGTPVSSGDALQHIQLSALDVDLEQVHALQALRSLGVHRESSTKCSCLRISYMS